MLKESLYILFMKDRFIQINIMATPNIFWKKTDMLFF